MNPLTLRGNMRRRVMINYRIQPAELADQIPAPLRLRLYRGYAMAGLCLFRVEQLRPSPLPAWLGMATENALCRVEVEWEDGNELRAGVLLQCFHTSSRFGNVLANLLLPGRYQVGKFDVDDMSDQIAVVVRDDPMVVTLKADVSNQLPATSLFPSLEQAVRFFHAGCLGVSATSKSRRLELVSLQSGPWDAVPLKVTGLRSSYFDDNARFPPGAVEFDSALLIRDTAHQWSRQRGQERVALDESLSALPSLPAGGVPRSTFGENALLTRNYFPRR